MQEGIAILDRERPTGGEDGVKFSIGKLEHGRRLVGHGQGSADISQ